MEVFKLIKKSTIFLGDDTFLSTKIVESFGIIRISFSNTLKLKGNFPVIKLAYSLHFNNGKSIGG